MVTRSGRARHRCRRQPKQLGIGSKFGGYSIWSGSACTAPDRGAG